MAATGTPASANPSAAENPMMWAMGKAITAVCPNRGLSAPSREAPISARWLMRTPFGTPVVPEV